MSYDYPILRKVVNYYKDVGKNVSDTHLVSCQHILEPQMEMYKGFLELGMLPENIILLGKAYSTNYEVLNKLESLGIRATQPKFLGGEFNSEHRDNCNNVFRMSDENGVVILDDGAELINVFSVGRKKVKFAVEQTSSGFRKLEGATFQFPVINVARSKTKLTQESPLVARHCFERVMDYVKLKKINKPSILVMGLGPIGNNLLQVIEEQGIEVRGYDKEDYASITEIIREYRPDIIIGATGTRIINEKEITGLLRDKDYHFISVSSSDVEFPVSSFRNNTNVHGDVVRDNIHFVNNGFPVTFFGNKYELTPVEIEKTICLLFGSVMHGVTYGYDSSGLVEVPKILEELINS